MRVNMSLPEDLVKRLDEYAKENYTSRSGLVSLACNQFLLARDVRKTLIHVQAAMDSIAKTKQLSEEDAKQLDDFCRLLAMMNVG